MARKSKLSRPSSPQGPISQPDESVRPGDPFFDNWLEDKLKKVYGSVLEEPVPDDLVRLITQKLKG